MIILDVCMVESFLLCHAPADNRVALIPKSTISGIFRLCDHDMSNHFCYSSDYAPIDTAISRSGVPSEIRQGWGLPGGAAGLVDDVPVVARGTQRDVLGHGMTENKFCQPA